MRFNAGKRMKVIYKSECDNGQIGMRDFILEIIYPLQQLPIEVLKEDDHSGQIYNPVTDTWSWL